MILRILKAKLAALILGAALLQTLSQCVPVNSTAFEDLTQTGGVLVGVLFIPQLP